MSWLDVVRRAVSAGATTNFRGVTESSRSTTSGARRNKAISRTIRTVSSTLLSDVTSSLRSAACSVGRHKVVFWASSAISNAVLGYVAFTTSITALLSSEVHSLTLSISTTDALTAITIIFGAVSITCTTRLTVTQVDYRFTDRRNSILARSTRSTTTSSTLAVLVSNELSVV